MKDLLEEATRALREEGEQPAPEAELTRARIVTALRRRRTVQFRAAVLLPLAAIVLTGGALGATGGLAPVVDGALGWLGHNAHSGGVESAGDGGQSRTAPRAPLGAGPAAVSAAPALPLQSASAAEPIPAVAPQAAATVIAAPSPSAPVRAASAATPSAMSSSEAERALDESLYRAAHEAHFRGGSPAAALSAWDRYLAGVPRGRFAAEASYNRALCLVRLGRVAEAKPVLERFAKSGYRSAEARELLDALGE